VRDVNAWLSGEGPTRAADASRLRRLGFVAGVGENFVTAASPGGAGLSLVEQFGSSQAARQELAAQVKAPPGGTYKAFAVAGIPGARGFDLSSGGSAGANVAWADGPFYYLVGAGSAQGAAHPPTHAQVIAAATVLYRRVHGHP
jgi:hypothetical protein